MPFCVTWTMKKMRDRLALLAFALCLLAVGSGCGTLWNAVVGPDDSANVDVDQLATYFDGEPKVRPGVALAISVTATGSSAMSAKQYFVDAEGCITMELVGRIKCDGLSLVGLQEKIAAAYKEFLLEPHVTATFIYQAGQNMVSPWGTVTVMGEVARPGPVDVPPTLDLRVTRALQLAGGVNPIADKRRVQVTRCDKDGKRTKTKIDLLEIGEEGRPDKDMLLRAGDVVWVPMSWY